MKPDTAIFGDMAFSQEVICDWLKDKSANIVGFEFEMYKV